MTNLDTIFIIAQCTILALGSPNHGERRNTVSSQHGPNDKLGEVAVGKFSSNSRSLSCPNLGEAEVRKY